MNTASQHFADEAALIEFLDGLHETNDDGAITNRKWDIAQRAIAGIRTGVDSEFIGGQITGFRLINGVHVIVANAFSESLGEHLLVKYDDYIAAVAAAIKTTEAKARAYDDGVICDVDTVGHMDAVRVKATDSVQAQRLRMLAPNRVRVVREAL